MDTGMSGVQRRFQFDPYLMRVSDLETMLFLSLHDGEVVDVIDVGEDQVSDRIVNLVAFRLAGNETVHQTVFNSELVPIDDEFNTRPTSGQQ